MSTYGVGNVTCINFKAITHRTMHTCRMITTYLPKNNLLKINFRLMSFGLDLRCRHEHFISKRKSSIKLYLNGTMVCLLFSELKDLGFESFLSCKEVQTGVTSQSMKYQSSFSKIVQEKHLMARQISQLQAKVFV